MSEIIQLTSDKAEFTNFISDTMVLKEESKVCLNKASFSIPVIVSNNIPLPYEGAVPDYGVTFFSMAINGVEHEISYQEFFDAYNVIDNFQTVTINEMYTGIFQLFVDNLATFTDATGADYELPTFTSVLVEACNTKFQYYKFLSDNVTEPINIGQEFFNTNLTINGINITNIKNFRKINQIGISCLYEPRKVTMLSPSTINWDDPAIVNNFTTAGDGITASDANPAMGASPNTFDPNGGWVSCLPNIQAGGKAAMGIVFMGKGHNDPINVSGVYQPENFDVGIEWYNDAGTYTFRIIDGHQLNVYSHGGSVQEDYVTNYVPPNKIFTFSNQSDYFFLLVRKGRTMNGTTEFTTSIIQTHNNPDIHGAENRVIYVAKTTLNNSQIRIQPLAYSDGAANELDHWRYIPKTDDSKQEDDYLDNIPVDGDNFDGISSANSMILQPLINNATDWDEERNFWTKMGIGQDDENFNVRAEFSNDGINRSIKWDLPKDNDKFYWIGEKYISNIIDPANPNYVSFNTLSPSFISQIPRQINVSIMDLPINPRDGNFVKSNGFFSTNSFNKVINYVQTDSNSLYPEENTTLDYVYEAFNLVYRKLNNRQEIPITQMKCKLSYKDFNTDNEQNINNLEGICKLEIIFD